MREAYPGARTGDASRRALASRRIIALTTADWAGVTIRNPGYKIRG
jgi:hypothetical protein